MIMDKLNVAFQHKKIVFRQLDEEVTQILDLLHYKSGLMKDSPSFDANARLILNEIYKEDEHTSAVR